MSYFQGTSLVNWILDLKYDNLFNVETDNKVCSIKTTLYFQKTSKFAECLIFVITDGNYFIPVLVHPDLARDQFQLSSDISDEELSTLKQKVILIKRSAVAAFRTVEGVSPYLIALDWEVLKGFPEQSFKPDIAYVSKEEKISSWIKSLNNHINGKSSALNSPISKIYSSRLIHRKFINFDQFEALMELFVCQYLNIGGIPSLSNNENQVQSVSIVKNTEAAPRKRSLIDETDIPSQKRSKIAQPSTSGVSTSSHVNNCNSNSSSSSRVEIAIELPRIAEITAPEIGPSFENPPTKKSKGKAVDRGPIPEQESRNIEEDTLTDPREAYNTWDDDDFPDSMFAGLPTTDTSLSVPGNFSIQENPNTPSSLSQNSNISQPSLQQQTPKLIQSSQSSSDLEEDLPDSGSLYDIAETAILDKIYKTGTSSLERRIAYSQLRNLRFMRSTSGFHIV